MGHPLSFPFLCVTNLSVYQQCVSDEAYRRYPGDAKARGVWMNKRMNAVVVNGDDMLFKCDRVFYTAFIELARSVGLHISIGKNYLSRDCCMINSQVFRLHRDGLMHRHDYLNLKLVTGTSLKTGDSAATPDQIGPAVQRMISRAKWTAAIVPDVFRRWQSWRYLYSGFRPNWYVPVHLGGFGIRPLSRWPVRYTREQRRVAAAMLLHPQISLTVRERNGGGVLNQIRKVLPRMFDFKLVPALRSRKTDEALEFNGYETFEHQSDYSERFMLWQRAFDPKRFIGDDIVPRSRLLTRREVRKYGLKPGSIKLAGVGLSRTRRISPLTEIELHELEDVELVIRPRVKPPPLQSFSLKSVEGQLDVINSWAETQISVFYETDWLGR